MQVAEKAENEVRGLKSEIWSTKHELKQLPIENWQLPTVFPRSSPFTPALTNSFGQV